MKNKEEIVGNWLPRYTGVPLDGFGEHILLTNFGGYLDHFAEMTGAEVVGLTRVDGAWRIDLAGGEPVQARRVVNAAGAWADASDVSSAREKTAACFKVTPQISPERRGRRR